MEQYRGIIEGSIEKARPPCVITLQKGQGASGVFGDDFGVMAFKTKNIEKHRGH